MASITSPPHLFLVILLIAATSTRRPLVHSQQPEEIYHAGLNGVAEINSRGVLRLTNESSRLIGHAFHPSPLPFKNSTSAKAFSFSTVFAFAIVPEYPKLGGHGFAFTIAPSKDLKGALPSQYLGILNATDVGNFSNHVFAVEFDTVQDFEFGDINDNHVGIDINSLASNATAAAAYFDDDSSTKQDLNLKSGNTIIAWVDYDSITNVLNVTLSSSSSQKPITPLLTFPIDLSPILLDSMYVGFSASTGLLASSHYIFGWSFKMNGQARPLLLASLPTLPSPGKSHATLTVALSTASATVVLVLLVLASIYLIKKIKNADLIESWELDVGPHRFSYKELKIATKGFRDKDLLGFGGFGRVYRGTLPNSKTQVAVKQISRESKQGVREFVSEIETIGRLRHRNLVQLQGWCRRRGDLLLVYDYMPNGSLDKLLFDEPTTSARVLAWEERFKIIKGVASGLLYLHQEWEQIVIHRDIKASNVLLDGELNGKLGDFGLARLYEHGANPSTTKVVGTLGYLAPELTRTGKGSTSTDVFAFGALLLEVACGRRPIEPKALPEELILMDWVWDKWSEGRVFDVVDQKLKGEFDEGEVVLVVKLGLMCSNSAPNARPSMRQVVRYLEGELRMPDTLCAPGEGKNGEGFDDLLPFSYTSNSSSSFGTKASSSTTYMGARPVGGDVDSFASTSPVSLLSSRAHIESLCSYDAPTNCGGRSGIEGDDMTI
ncbi:hypothetical protein Sjap_001827 [Stephania japonica]|uniref:non-specific serine/threonine protein kinase n=1 Tax=Stephania japonica TaxID=461633 RepID=A0AAP0KKN5_9MAGN